MKAGASAAAICPLCGAPNDCGAVTGAGPCWCETVAVREDFAGRLPELAGGAVCVCKVCVEIQGAADGHSPCDS